MIRVASPALLGNEKRYVMDALNRGDIALGEYTSRFEELFGKTVNTTYAHACNSGTSALILALRALGLRPGDEVIVPALTYIATANAVSYFGATPVVVDVDPTSWCIDPIAVADEITPKTRGVIAVHLYGRPCAMRELRAAVGSRRFIVEDAAEAHGAQYCGRPVGSIGDVGCFSFYGNKIITTGEGGMVTTNDPDLAKRIVDYRDGYTHGEHRYHHEGIGFNFRMSNLTAAFGLGQLECLSNHLAIRNGIAMAYEHHMPHGLGVKMQGRVPNTLLADWMVSVVLPERVDRDKVMRHLAGDNIETRPIFWPIHMQTPYWQGSGPRPCAERIAFNGLNLPTHVNMTESDVIRVCEALAHAIKVCRVAA